MSGIGAGATSLEAFRGPDVEAEQNDRVQILDDNAEPSSAAIIVREPAAVEPPANDDAPQAPTQVRDPRAEMASRFNRRRGEQHADAENIDPLSAPIEALAPGNDNQPNPVNDNRPATYTLKVNRQDIPVSREDLLASCEMTADEAADVPDSALVRIAQKNIAVQMRLDEVKKARSRAPDSIQTDAHIQADAFQPSAPAHQQKSDVELIREVQLGDEAEALAAQNELYDRRDRERQTQRIRQSVMQDVSTAVETFGRDNPDIANDVIAADLLRTLSVREAVEELRVKCGLPDHECAQLLNDPNLATQAYNGARMQAHARGWNLRSPREVFDAAGQTVRSALKMGAPESNRAATQNQAPPQSRLEMKRALPTQPVRSGAVVSHQVAAPAPDSRDASATIAKMRASRQQG